MNTLLSRRLAALEDALGPITPISTEDQAFIVLFLSWTDGSRRATVRTLTGHTTAEIWQKAHEILAPFADCATWLRVDRVNAIERTDWKTLRTTLPDIKRNYFRLGISLDARFTHAFLECELNANAMLYGGPSHEGAQLNRGNFARYAAERHDLHDLDFSDRCPIWLFKTSGAFIGKDNVVHALDTTGLSTGRRSMPPLRADDTLRLITRGSRYLATQVRDDGLFHYGWHPCFDKPVDGYNCLRHASTVYAMLEAWEATRDETAKAAIDKALHRLTTELIRTVALPDGSSAAFLVDSGDEIKLGGNALSILALVKHCELTGDFRHRDLLDNLARGVRFMQDDATGGFFHVLHYPSLAIKAPFRTIYYDGEAALSLMRLFILTGKKCWLNMVERACDHFIREERWKEHDHWLSYCVNELTMWRRHERYIKLGIDNIRNCLDFVERRITTFPTLLELMMSAEAMIARVKADPECAHLLSGVDLERFYDVLHYRANYLVNGHFWPEMAMFFANPDKIEGSFFIRHQAFRIRIDDVEHYLSGLVSYRNFLISRESRQTMIRILNKADH